MKNRVQTLKSFINGVVAALPTILLVLLASSIKFILEEGMILATISNSISKIIAGKNKVGVKLNHEEEDYDFEEW